MTHSKKEYQIFQGVIERSKNLQHYIFGLDTILQHWNSADFGSPECDMIKNQFKHSDNFCFSHMINLKLKIFEFDEKCILQDWHHQKAGLIFVLEIVENWTKLKLTFQKFE